MGIESALHYRMRLKIRVTTVEADENSYAEYFEVNKQHCVIGRQGADVPLPDPGCSRRHAMLYEGPQGELRVTDLHSTNGTFIGKERVIDRAIAKGEVIRLGAMLVDVIEAYGVSAWLDPPASRTAAGRVIPPPLPEKDEGCRLSSRATPAYTICARSSCLECLAGILQLPTLIIRVGGGPASEILTHHLGSSTLLHGVSCGGGRSLCRRFRRDVARAASKALPDVHRKRPSR